MYGPTVRTRTDVSMIAGAGRWTSGNGDRDAADRNATDPNTLYTTENTTGRNRLLPMPTSQQA